MGQPHIEVTRLFLIRTAFPNKTFKDQLIKEKIVSFQNVFKRSLAIAAVSLFIAAGSVYAQTPAPTPVLVIEAPRERRVAERNNLYCAGFVQTSPIDTSNRIVGALDEEDGHIFSENEVMYINMGANKGVKVGDIMSVVRPRGRVKTRWTDKGNLGFYVQELGALEVIRVKQEVSVVRVRTSCDNLLLGDLVQPVPARTSPLYTQRPALDVYADPTGKAIGRLFMARDKAEVLSTENIVYIDLGSEDNVQVGDYLTIFRPLGTGNIFDYIQPESIDNRSSGYQSDEYRGGHFSNQAARKSGERAQGKVVTSEKARSDRPAIRKIVGEMVILNVKERTATAMITRNAQEIHTGDWVEVQ